MKRPGGCTRPSLVRCAGKTLDTNWWFTRVSRWRDWREARRMLAPLFRMHAGRSGDLKPERSRRLSGILRFAWRHCPYYRELFQSAGMDPTTLEGFERLPLLDRATVRSRANGLVPDCIRRVEHTLKSTGGSTSQPLEFPLARAVQYVDHAHYEFTYKLMGWKPGDPIASFAGPLVREELRENNIFWNEVEGGRDLPYGRVFYSQFYLDERTMPHYLDHIIRLRPAILRGYPSLIDRIAEYIAENGIRLPFALKGVQLNSEVAYDWQVENIRTAFGAPVTFQYGQSEAGVFAYTDPDGSEYRCSPFFGLTEVLDEEGLHVGPGETGEVVVTGFHNYALPFVRYRTGDLAAYGGEENGVVRIARIEGREQEYLRTTDGKKVMLTGLVNVKAFGRVRRWQVVQDVPDRATVRIVKDDGFSESDWQAIENAFRDLYGVEADIEVADHIPLTASGKLQMLIQRIPT